MATDPNKQLLLDQRAIDAAQVEEDGKVTTVRDGDTVTIGASDYEFTVEGGVITDIVVTP